ncbi:MAG: hypothetical protein ACOY0T_33305 [Myxococcota bacterium]
MGAKRDGWARHLEGWELGLLAVGIALLGVWLGLPRPVEPRVVPLPEIDRRVIARARAFDDARAELARTSALSFEVRAVGEEVRRHGAAIVRGDLAGASQARDQARRLTRALKGRTSVEPLQMLRAVQTQLFLQAMGRFRKSGKPDRELEELGANFIEKARAAGWIAGDGTLLLDDEALRALYRVRWAELTGALENAALRPSLDEFRLYYRVLLEHPEGLSPLDQDEHRLGYVNALSRLDGEFPGDLARGVLLYRLGRPQAAYLAFSAHAAAHGDGAWSLRVRNYALAALAQASATE